MTETEKAEYLLKEREKQHRALESNKLGLMPNRTAKRIVERSRRRMAWIMAEEVLG